MHAAVVISQIIRMAGRLAVVGVLHKSRLQKPDRVAHVPVRPSAHLPDPPVRKLRIRIIGRSVWTRPCDFELPCRPSSADGKVVQRISQLAEIPHDVRVCFVDRAQIIDIGASSHRVGCDAMGKFMCHDIQAFDRIIDIADGKIPETVPVTVKIRVVDRSSGLVADAAQNRQGDSAPVNRRVSVIIKIIIHTCDVVQGDQLFVLPPAVRVRRGDPVFAGSVDCLLVIRHQNHPVQVHQIIPSVLPAPGNRNRQADSAAVMQCDVAGPGRTVISLEHRLGLPLQGIILLQERGFERAAGQIHHVLPVITDKMLQIRKVAVSGMDRRVVGKDRPDMLELFFLHDSCTDCAARIDCEVLIRERIPDDLLRFLSGDTSGRFFPDSRRRIKAARQCCGIPVRIHVDLDRCVQDRHVSVPLKKQVEGIAGGVIDSLIDTE